MSPLPKKPLPSLTPRQRALREKNVIHAYNLARARKSRPYPLVRRVADTGLRTDSFMSLIKYTDSCRNDRVLPQPDEILRCLMHKAAALGLFPASPPAITY